VLVGLVRREWGYVPRAYAGLVAAAREAGLGVLTLDRRLRRPDGFCRLGAPRCGGRAAGWWTGSPASSPLPRGACWSSSAATTPGPAVSRESRSRRFTTGWDEIDPLLSTDGEPGGIFLSTPRDRIGRDGFVALP
jgi:hypothetical protein